MALCKFTTEFLGAINGRVHLASKIPLSVAECANHLVQRQSIAYHHYVDIAGARLVSGRHGAVDKSQTDIGRQIQESVSQNVGNPESLADYAAQLVKYRAAVVGLKVGLATFHRSCENSAAGELFELPLNGARSHAERADDLPLVKTPAGLAEQQAQYRLACSAEKRGSSTHIGYDSTQYGFSQCQPAPLLRV